MRPLNTQKATNAPKPLFNPGFSVIATKLIPSMNLHYNILQQKPLSLKLAALYYGNNTYINTTPTPPHETAGDASG